METVVFLVMGSDILDYMKSEDDVRTSGWQILVGLI
jgi:hypothetical protein